jgi:hypothetical protein
MAAGATRPGWRSAISGTRRATSAAAQGARSTSSVGQEALELVAAPRQGAGALPAHLACELFSQAGLAHAGLTAQEHQGSFTAHRLLPAFLQDRQLALPAHEGGRHDGVQGAATSGQGSQSSRCCGLDHLHRPTDLKASLEDSAIELGCLHHRLHTQFLPHQLAAVAVLLQGGIALAQVAVGAHDQPVRLFPQRIMVQQPQGRGQRLFVLPFCLLTAHQAYQCIVKQGFQPVALVEDPVVVEAIEKVTSVKGDRRFQMADLPAGDLDLEAVDVKPNVRPRIELHHVGIGQDHLLGKTAADVPQGSGQRLARLRLRPVTPKEASQTLPGLGLAAMMDQIGQQGLGLECRWLGQRLVSATDVQRAQKEKLQFGHGPTSGRLSPDCPQLYSKAVEGSMVFCALLSIDCRGTMNGREAEG